MEMLLGGKVFAVVGAILVVFAAGFFATYVNVLEWIGSWPPGVKCAAMAGLAAVLLIAGELALRRIGKAASVGLFGAGLGVAYLTALAAHHNFHLVSEVGAFILLGVVAVGGFAITLRTRFATIGVLSMIGGYLAPLMLGGVLDNLPVCGAYLTMLLAVSLALSAWQPRPFRLLRYVAMSAHGIVGLALILRNDSDSLPSLAMITLWWAMIHVEAVWAAIRGQSRVGNAVVSVLTNAWFVLFGCGLLMGSGPSGPLWLGAFTAAIAAVCVAIAATFGSGLEVLRSAPRRPMDLLASVLLAQAGVLITVAIAMQFQELGQIIGWLAVALGSIECGRRIRSRGLDVFGIVLLFLAVLRALFSKLIGALATPLWTIGTMHQVEVNAWALLMLAVIAGLLIASLRLRTEDSPGWRPVPVLGMVVGSLMWVLLCSTQCTHLAVTGGWLLGAVALLALSLTVPRLRTLEIGAIMLLATAGRWLLVDAVKPRMSPAWDAAAVTPLFNMQMGLVVLIALAGWWLAKLLQRRGQDTMTSAVNREGALWQIATIVLALFMLIGCSFELDRLVAAQESAGLTFRWPRWQALNLMLTVLWTFGALGLHALAVMNRRMGADGRSRPAAILSAFAWLLIACCALKWLVFDTMFPLAEHAAARLHHWPGLNLQFLAIGLIVAAVIVMVRTGGLWNSREDDALSVRPATWLPVACWIIILWGLSFELERLIARHEAATAGAIWPPTQLRLLWWTLLWSAGGLAMAAIGRWRSHRLMQLAGAAIIMLSAIAWLAPGALAWRLTEGPAACRVVLNLQFLVGAAVTVMLAVSARLTAAAPRQIASFSWALAAITGLAMGSLEIDRAFDPARATQFADAAMVRQAALSVYWGLYALIMIVFVGFVKRSAMARYAGLALLVITLSKVLLIDMAQVHKVYRVLSFLGLGLLLIGTSIIYTKYSPRLLNRNEDQADQDPRSSP